ncbi:MAG: TATA-box-binding protein [Methanocellales archaeon]|nr:TATA-box-binding protein [Methanocellales archaeon]
MGINAQLSREVEISNIVVAANLDAIATNSGLENVEYEPEQFPGLIYHLNEDNIKCTILLFHSGKMIIAGLKDVNKIHKVMERLISDLEIV